LGESDTRAFQSNKVHLCSIVNAGACSRIATSAHNRLFIKPAREMRIVDPEPVLGADEAKKGVTALRLVAAWKGLKGPVLDEVAAYHELAKAVKSGPTHHRHYQSRPWPTGSKRRDWNAMDTAWKFEAFLSPTARLILEDRLETIGYLKQANSDLFQ
jgi:hypothetical protein